MERGRQFFPSPADRIDVQAREPGDEPVPAMPEPGTLDGGVPAPLLLIEPTEQEIHLLVDFLVRMGFLAKAVGALAVMDFLLRHGLTLRDGPMDSTTSLQKKPWNLFLDGPLGRTYVAVHPGDKPVLGYYTLASGALSYQNLAEYSARRLPRHPVPVILLARLAVDQSVQGKGWGEGLLIDALQRVLGLADKLGIHAVEVDAIDQQAKAFYEKYGFVPLLDNGFHLFLPIATIQSAIQRP